MGIMRFWWAGLIVLFSAAATRIGTSKYREYEFRRQAMMARPRPVRLPPRTPRPVAPVQPVVTEEPGLPGPLAGFFTTRKDFMPVRYARLRAAPSVDGRCLDYVEQCEGEFDAQRDLLQDRSTSKTIFRVPANCQLPPSEQTLHLIVWRLTDTRGRVLNVPTTVGIDFRNRSRQPFNRLPASPDLRRTRPIFTESLE